MSNWFEDHPVKTIIGHTILIGGAVFAFSKFILIENTEHLYKAQLETKEASIAQYEARISFLEDENTKLENEVNKYLEWVQNTPGTVQYVEKINEELEKQLAEEKEKNILDEGEGKIKKYYQEYKNISGDNAIVDKETEVVFALKDIKVNGKADLSFSIPTLGMEEVENVSPGYIKEFAIGEKTYQFIIVSINYVPNTCSIILKEL